MAASPRVDPSFQAILAQIDADKAGMRAVVVAATPPASGKPAAPQVR